MKEGKFKINILLSHLEFVDGSVVGEQEEHSHLVQHSLHRLCCLNRKHSNSFFSILLFSTL